MRKEEGKFDEFSDIKCIEDAFIILQSLKDKVRLQAQQILIWRRAYKLQESFILQLQNENANQLKSLSLKLMLFEARLMRKQKDISVMLNHRESIIHKQQKVISLLNNRLLDNGLETLDNEEIVSDINMLDFDSINDTDSAVVMEDLDPEITQLSKYDSYSCDDITISRSISDAMNSNLKYNSRRSTGGYLKRPEILETVYSVEEDGDNDQANEETSKRRQAFASSGKSAINNNSSQKQDNDVSDSNIKRKSSWPKEKDESQENKTSQVITYNRVMSNHRSVTKPKDVKYKRINKAKSKSLEELRGRLKSWVEQGTKLTSLKLEHGHSFA